LNSSFLTEGNENLAPFDVTMGRVPFDQKFWFELPKFSYAEWNGIFQHTGPISRYSCLGTFPANILLFTRQNAE